MEELYINDKKVDLGNARITLNHKSNLLGDISTINASNSLTIRLPKTIRNREILDCPDQPSYTGKYLRKYINARYFRNGIEILKGFAVLLASSDTYEICLSWGELFELTEFLNEDDMLNEYLEEGMAIEWGQDTIFDNKTYGAFYYNDKDKLQDKPIHPSVFVSEILQKIQDKSGLVFKFPQETTEWLADKKVLCATRNSSKKLSEKQTAEFIKGGNLVQTEFTNLKKILFTYSKQNYAIEGNLEEPDNYIKIDEDLAELRIKPNIKIVLKDELDTHMDFVIYDDVPENGGKKINYLPLKKIDGKTYELANTTLVITNTKGSYYFYIEYLFDVSSIDNYDSKMSVNVLFKDNTGAIGEVSYPGYFPPYINLPEISLADFVKNISALTGTFPHRYKSDATNEITFSPLEIIYQNKSKGIDWSDKLIFRGYPKEVGYKVNDMARKNYLQYKEDEQVPTRGSGIIEVNDQTLAREKDLFDMAFSASEIYNEAALIHKYEKTNDELEEINIEPRILSSYQDKSKLVYLTFAGMSFYDILKTRYQGYQRIMREPIVLKEDFRLTELDIKNINFTIPIFLRQYGRYYAVMKIQDTNGICNVELLQLN